MVAWTRRRLCADYNTARVWRVLVCWLIQAARTVGLKHVKSAEDDDFMAAFDKMMSETLQVHSFITSFAAKEVMLSSALVS